MSIEGKEELGVLQVNVGSGKVFENVNKGKDMFVQISFNSQTKKTTTKKYTDKPTWDENFDIPVYKALEDNSVLVFELYATDGSGDSVLGKGTVQKLKYFTNGEDMVFNLSLENLNVTTGAGQLTVTVRPLGCAEPPEQNQNLSTPTVVVRDRSFAFPVEEPVVMKNRSFAFGVEPVPVAALALVAVADSRADNPVSPRRAPKTMLIATNTKTATAPEPASARSGVIQSTDTVAAEPVSTYSGAIQATDAVAAEPVSTYKGVIQTTDVVAAEPVSTYSGAIQATDAVAAEPVSAPSKPVLATYTLAAAPGSARSGTVLATDKRAAEPVSPRRAPISPRSPRLKSPRAQTAQAPAQGKQIHAKQSKTEHLLIMVRHAVITARKTKLPNPYVKVGYCGVVFRTPILAQTVFPRWEEEFQFDFDAQSTGSLQVEMYDRITESADPDAFMGKAVGSVDTNYGDGMLHEHTLPLLDLDKQPVGTIVLCALKR